ncbi:peptidoglycan-binding protein [Streptomyces sp. JJ66]|uniref:peptidoglycan-binding protein n=1 Tax=Streptomyces sp. JJ66 TaxID=2803843 RepID=UPI001C58B09F|nr:peptidoglycan-binding protein [Streptomyces sp. JJ66]MBW1602596.1 peptidoglycan-binding protein [Streptomyces sp. JJ66]
MLSLSRPAAAGTRAGTGRGPLVLLALLMALTGLFAAPSPAVAAPSFTVRQVQMNLAGLAYLPANGIDGIAGPATAAAVRAFQSENCLAVDGIAGPNTNSALAQRVKAVQRAAGATADGIYGPRTETAVLRYQRTHDLLEDGIAGPQTMGAMGVSRGACAGGGGGGGGGGDSGLPYPSSHALQVQWNLAGMGYLPWSGVDGILGPQTASAVRAFQRDACITVDGIAGPVTDSHLARQVRKVQRKAGSTADGAYGPNTKSAVERYQRANGLSVDGMAGPATMRAMDIDRAMSCDGGGTGANPTPPASGSTREKIVEIARSQLGVRETGNNCNPYGWCAAWCAMFGTWVWQEAGVDVPSYAFTGAWFNWGQRNGHSSWGYDGVQAGDAIMYGTGPSSVSTSTHVDLVERVNANGTLTVIGGNVSDAVTRRTINPASAGIYGYVRP